MSEAAIPRAPSVVVVLDQPAGAEACWVEAPDRVLRIWALLGAAGEELRQVTLPPGVTSRLHQQLQAVIAELQNSISPALAGELNRLILPEATAPVTAADLRVELASLTGWVSGLVIAMLSQLEPRLVLTGGPATPVSPGQLLATAAAPPG